LRFSIYKGSLLEYQETKNTTTDEFGMVNVIIGSGSYAAGTSTTLSGVTWDGNAKNLVVEVDTKATCANFSQISNQPFTYVPYAFYADNSGTPGPQGPAGPTGATGAQGPQGIAGAQGPIGLTGPAGATGPQGPQGQAGATGANGLQGANGLSAYQVAVANGFSGTQTQWLASLVGSQGVQGIQGVAGIDGKTALINTSVEPSGTNCPNGGTKIEVGLDINSNGVLDNSEINASQTKYVCNGPQGIAGPAGPTSSSIGANAAFSDAISSYYNDFSICGKSTKIAVSDNGKYIILGCSSEPINGISYAGRVSVLKYENGNFENIGQEIVGTTSGSRYGVQVGISGDGQTIFFTTGTTLDNCYIYKLVNNVWVLHSTITGFGGSYATKMNVTADLIVHLDNSGNTTQSVTFYNLVGANWVPNQFSANGILGNSDLEISNDGSIIAISNPNQNLGVYSSTSANGRIGVFYYNGTTFTQKGNFIEGPNANNWGDHFCLSHDGLKVGISTIMNDQQTMSYIRTYQYETASNSWQQYNNELTFKSDWYSGPPYGGGGIVFLDFDSSTNYLLVAHKREYSTSVGSPASYHKSYYLMLKNQNNNWSQFGTTIEFKPFNESIINGIPDYYEFKSNKFFHIMDSKLKVKDFN
jgi:hypothetical protein